jgi:hypothetical protein
MRFERDHFQRRPIIGTPVANHRKRGGGDGANLGPFPAATGILEPELIVPMLARCLIMADVVDTLVLDLLEWVGPAPRPYAEVIEAWHSSCPRLPVWESANEHGFIERGYEPGRGAVVAVSASGLRYLQQHRGPQAGGVSKGAPVTAR